MMKNRERVNRCPNSDSVLYQALLLKDEKVAVELEQCDDCGGIFLNDFVVKSRKDKDLLLLHQADLAKLQQFKEVRRTSHLRCPECSEEMESLTLKEIPDNFIIAYCRICDALWYNLVYIPSSDPGWIEGRGVSEVFAENERREIMNSLTYGLDSLLVTATMNPYDTTPGRDVESVAGELPRGHASNIKTTSRFVLEMMLALPEPQAVRVIKKFTRPDRSHLKELVEQGEHEVKSEEGVAILMAPMLTAMRARDLLDDENIKCSIDYDKEEREYSLHPRLNLTVSAADEPRARVILSEAFRTERIKDSLS